MLAVVFGGNQEVILISAYEGQFPEEVVRNPLQNLTVFLSSRKTWDVGSLYINVHEYLVANPLEQILCYVQCPNQTRDNFVYHYHNIRGNPFTASIGYRVQCVGSLTQRERNATTFQQEAEFLFQ